MSAKVDIGDGYDGCPYCGAAGYFHCHNCGLFSCWNKYNQKPHLDHHDIWCAGCKSWRCTSGEDDGEDSSIELTAYAQHEDQVRKAERTIAESTTHDQISPLSSTRRYLR